MKRAKALLFPIILTLLFLFNSCLNNVVSKNPDNKIDFETVVLTRQTVESYFSNPDFKYFRIEFKPTMFKGVLLEVTAYDINNSVMKSKIRLKKLDNTIPTQLLNDYRGQYFLTKERMIENGMNGSTDYILRPMRYLPDSALHDSTYLRDSVFLRNIIKSRSSREIKGDNYVSYRVVQLIQPFRKDFSQFTLDPSPPAY